MSCDVVWEDSIIFPWTSYLIDFLEQHVLKENKTNCFVFSKKRSLEKLFCYFYVDQLIYFLNNRISPLIGSLSSYLLKLQFADFGYSPGIEQSRISYFQDLNTLRKLEPLGFTHGPYQEDHTTKSHTVSYGPSYAGNANQMFIKQ